MMAVKSTLQICVFLLIVFCIGCSHHTKQDAIDSIYEAQERGRALLSQGQASAAIKEFQQAYILDPADWHNHYYLAKAYEQSGNLDAAIAELREVTKIHYRTSNPASYAFSHFWLAKALLKKGQRDEARQQYRLARDIAGQDKTHNKKIGAIAQQSEEKLQSLK